MESRRRRLIVHIGLPKTGSSALQGFFAAKADALAAHDISYHDLVGNSDEGAITSGNGLMLHRFLYDEARQGPFDDRGFLESFESTYFAGRSIALISRENLWKVDASRLDAFLAHVSTFADVTVVAFVRDVYGDAYATWMQHIKGRPMVDPFREFARQFVPRFSGLHRWSSHCSDFQVLHYNSTRDDLLGAFCRAARLPDEVAKLGPLRTVNRSLDFEEASALLQLNEMHGGRLSKRLSEALLQADPTKKTELPLFQDVADSLVARFASHVDDINAKFFGAPVLRVIDEAAIPMRGEAPTTDLSPTQRVLFARLVEDALLGVPKARATVSSAEVVAHLVGEATSLLRRGRARAAYILARAASRLDGASTEAKNIEERSREALTERG